jgi:DNA-binding NtrC family response regulator
MWDRVETQAHDAGLVSRLDPHAISVVASIGAGAAAVVGRAVLEGDKELVIGTAPEAGLRLSDATVSRQHVRLLRTPQGIRVTDLESTNGVYLDGARLYDAVVPVGAQLQVGRVHVALEPQETAVSSSTSRSRFGGLVGGDPRTLKLFATLEDLAKSDATLVLEGETGTGKEVVAQALHEASPRSKHPFVVFDCGSVPKDLIESALFGHVKGAFTGATESRVGAFKRAHNGTIFLDEIGELPLELQPRLLRVLESRTIQPVGGDEPVPINARVICATHRSLKGDIKAGRFREDLYYRLAVVKVRLPALRERPADIPILAQYFADAWALRRSTPTPKLDPRGVETVSKNPFPGNVRELRNLVERALAFAQDGDRAVDLARFAHDFTEPDTAIASLVSAPSASPITAARGDAIRAAALEALDGHRSFRDAKAMIVDAFERAFLGALLEQTGNNLSKASLLAQMDRKHLRELGRRHGLLPTGNTEDD